MTSGRVTADAVGGAARGALTLVAGSGGRFVAQTSAMIVVARVIGPTEYAFAVLTVLVAGLTEILRTAVFGTAVSRAGDLPSRASSAVHTVAVLTGIGSGAVIAGGSGILATVLDLPSVTTVALLGLVPALSMLSAVPTGLAARDLRFRGVALVETAAAVTAAGLAIVVAVLGGGHVALVVQVVAVSAVSGVGLLLLRPVAVSPGVLLGRRSALRDARQHLALSGHLSVATLLGFVARSTDRVVVSAVLGPAAGGVYAQASQLAALPVEQLAGPLQRVVVPVLARAHGDAERLRQVHRTVLGVTGTLLLPLSAFLAVVSGDLVHLVFGPEWSATGPVLAVLLAASAAQLVGLPAVWLLTASGRGSVQSRWAICSRPLVALAPVIGLPWGVLGVAWAMTAVSVLLVVPGAVIAARGTGVRLRDSGAALVGPLVSTALVGTAALAASALSADSSVIVRLVLASVGAAAGAAVAIAVPPVRRPVVEALRLLRRPGTSEARDRVRDSTDPEHTGGTVPVPTVSVVVPVGRVDAALHEQLASIAAQRLAPGTSPELVLAVNAGELSAVESAGRTVERAGWSVSVVDARDRPGPSHARNVGWRAATSDVVLFCDGDDLLDEGWVATMADALATEAICGSRVDYDRLNEPERAARWSASVEALPVKFRHLPFTPSAALGVRRDLLQEIGGFDESLRCGEDIDLCWRAAYRGHPIAFVPDAVLHYRLRADAGSAFRQSFAYASDDGALLRRHRAHGARWRPSDCVREAASTALACASALRGPQARVLAASRVGAQLGRVRTSWRHRVFAL